MAMTTVPKLMKASADVVSEIIMESSTDVCLQKGHEAIVDSLIEAGADINVSRPDGRTALMNACEAGQEAVVEKLIKKNANVNAKCDNGQTVLIKACTQGHEAVVQKLIRANANVNAKDHNGRTPLSEACRKGNETIVATLLEAGADFAVMNNGQTALMRPHSVAMKQSWRHCLRRAISVEDHNGQTALMEPASMADNRGDMRRSRFRGY